MEQYCIYFVVTKTNTLMGKVIRALTKCNYNHVSISLDESLQPMYSFSRFRNNVPLVGGFVEESWLRYIFYEKDIEMVAYKVPVNKITYIEIQNLLKAMYDNRESYLYDSLGAIGINKKFSENHYTCLSFAVYVLEMISGQNMQIDTIKGLMRKLSEYSYSFKTIRVEDGTKYSWGNDQYYVDMGFFEGMRRTFKHFSDLIFEEAGAI